MEEHWIAHHSLIEAGLIADGRIDVFIKRRLRSGRYLRLSQLVRAFPFDAEPYAVSYLAVDRLVASKGPLALRTWCERVGAGEEWTAAFQAVFGESVDDFYRRLEEIRSHYAPRSNHGGSAWLLDLLHGHRGACGRPSQPYDGPLCV